MKLYAIGILLILFSFISVYSADAEDFKKKYMHCLEDLDLNIDNEKITISDDDEDYTVRITCDGDLYINGEYIELDDDQQELVEDYHGKIMEIVDRAKDIGIEGAKLGVDGAKIGLHAISGVFKLLREDYDSEDLERELEKKAEELEKKAEALEKEAEKLDAMADELEEIHDELKDSVPELSNLDSF